MHKRSKPIPVSTCVAGSGTKDLSAFLSNCMNTLFQISTTCGWSLFTSSLPGFKAISASSRKSIWISEQGPQGPTSPISQKLSFLLPNIILSSPPKIPFQISHASWSKGTLSAASPPKTDT